MNSVRGLTHEQMSVMFGKVVENNKFSHYYTNHDNFRILVNLPKGKAIIRETLLQEEDNNGYTLTMYSVLENIDMKLIEKIAECHGCECKTSILNAITAQIK